jgi:hypothetical protein
MKVLLLYSFLILQSLSFNDIKNAHVFHISKTDMTFQPKDKALQITMHIFIDDLEAALEKQGYKSLFVGSEREKQESNSLIFNYLKNNFIIKLNNKNVNCEWIGKETTPDKQALWVYLEVKNIKDIKQIYVENKVLTELYDDQKNIIQVNIPSKKQGYFLLDKRKTNDSVVF